MKYRVVVAETTTKIVTIEAISQEEALMTAADMYNDGEIDMNKNVGYTEASFRIDNLFEEM